MAHDHAHGSDGLGVGAGLELLEPAHARTVWHIDRYDDDQTGWVRNRSGVATPQAHHFRRAKVTPYDSSVVLGNLVTTAGWTRLTSLAIGGGGQAADNTHTRLGAGDGAGTAAAADTDLSASAGSTHRWFQVMDATYPQVASNVITFRATFGTADGNMAWNEFGIDISATAASSGNTVNATLLNHKTSIAQGTKASGQTWVATATLTFT